MVLNKYNFSGNSIILTKEIKIDINKWHYELLKDIIHDGYAEIRGCYCDECNRPLDDVISAYHDLIELNLAEESEMAWHQTLLPVFANKQAIEDMFAYAKSVLELEKINEVLT